MTRSYNKKTPKSDTKMLTGHKMETFSKELPEELKLDILDTILKAQPPQSIRLHRLPSLSPSSSSSSPDFMGIRTELYQTSYSLGLPAVLHTSQYSREQALKHYDLAFGGVDKKPKYINWAKDGFEIHWEVLWNLQSIIMFYDLSSVLKDCSKVQNLIINILPDTGYPGWPSVLSLYFEDLRTITIRQYDTCLARFYRDVWQLEPEWEYFVNPARVEKGKQPNPAPTVAFE